MFDLLRSHMDDLLAGRADPVDAGPVERLRAFAKFHIETSLEHSETVFLSYMELRNLSPDNHVAITRLRRHYEDALDRILHAGAAMGVMRG